MDRGAWRTTVCRITELDMTEETDCACMQMKELGTFCTLYHIFIYNII